MKHQIRTRRLLLRQWKKEDRQYFAAMNNDSDVMHYFPRKYTREESDSFIDDNINRITIEGWGCWAVEIIDTGEFIGFVGLSKPADYHPCAGEIDIGWRLSKQFWGNGYATEATKAVLPIAFNSIGLDQIVSFTSECNFPSISIMRKIGMVKDHLGFEHPFIDADSHLRSHVVYRLHRSVWKKMS